MIVSKFNYGLRRNDIAVTLGVAAYAFTGFEDYIDITKVASGRHEKKLRVIEKARNTFSYMRRSFYMFRASCQRFGEKEPWEVGMIFSTEEGPVE